MGEFLQKLSLKKEEFCTEAVELDHYLDGVNFKDVKEQCNLEL